MQWQCYCFIRTRAGYTYENKKDFKYFNIKAQKNNVLQIFSKIQLYWSRTKVQYNIKYNNI